ncbi:MAG: DUF72 domain-containing protein [Planctomycetota bacterium]|nr:MAG: DUF72 domain-containing protein [Planctomycetota bacterium]
MARSRIHVGTSGWTYSDWRGTFYPPGTKSTQLLEYYASRFDTVEVNATFYRLPTDAMIASWNRRLPQDFHLVLKGPRTVTHLKKLIDADEPLQTFLQRAAALEKLRVILWQLPPSLHHDPQRLHAFLERLPDRWRHAVEFRHASWWNDETVRLLRSFNVAFVAVSHPELPKQILPTGDFLYLRFHGEQRPLYRYDYSDDELRAWADAVRPHLRGRELYAFFNNDVDAHAPFNALRFRELLTRSARR